MNLEPARQAFIVESQELLATLEQALLALESAPTDKEHLTAAFRSAHTIKGSAGMFGYERVVSFTHVVEGVLERVRDGALQVNGDLIELLLACRDHITLLIAHGDDEGKPLPAAALATGRSLADRLQAHLAVPAAASAAPRSAAPAARDAPADAWQISLRFGRDVLRNGMEPMSFIRYLATLGEITSLSTLLDAMPAAGEMDPESCYLGMEIGFRSTADQATIAGVFEFVREDSSINIQPAGIPAQAAVTQAVAPSGPAGAVQEANFVRVRADKLDQLINLVGELVISGASTSLLARATRSEALQEAASNMARLVEQVRDGTLQLRMVQIGETFNRFPRLVRDVGRELGKEIELVIGGAETELDKSMIERISDPLMHLVRNAIDHGIEPAAAREARGKPARGQVRLNACHDSGSIVIEVGDDGEGLNRDRILAKAVSLGMAQAGQPLGDREIFDFIWEPGFSTAAQLSNLSGRGVGMDVVKRSIEALRGSVEIDSTPGRGSTFRLRLPLTLAIIDGFLVQVGKASYVVPLDMVVECLELGHQDLQARDGRHYVNLRGEVLPFVRLGELFEIGADRVGVNQAARENIVVVQWGGRRAGLVVDRLQGEIQTVIKPLSRIFSKLKGIGGSTILGSGEVALILDVPSLVEVAGDAETAAAEAAAAGSACRARPTSLSPQSDSQVGGR